MAALPDGEVFRVREVAHIMKCTVAMVWAMIHRGELPAFKLGRQWRVKREDLEAKMQRQNPELDPLC